MSFPQVTLTQEYEAQTRYASNTVKTLQIEDNVDTKTLRAFVQLGDDPSFKYWITVLDGTAYTVDWTNQDVANAITTFFTR